jgi:hypothetical protein
MKAKVGLNGKRKGTDMRGVNSVKRTQVIKTTEENNVFSEGHKPRGSNRQQVFNQRRGGEGCENDYHVGRR